MKRWPMNKERTIIKIEKIDTTSEEQVNRFVQIPYRLYANHPHWVPPLFADAKMYLNRQAHPFYAYSEADFFIAVRDGRDVGRIAVFELDSLIDYRNANHARFYLFECEEDMEAVTALFEAAFAWARARALPQITGPYGFTMLDPHGILVEGFDHPQVMDMTTYNHSYYPELIEKVGFKKKDDFFSYHIENRSERQFPARIHAIAEWVRETGEFTIKNFTTMAELFEWVPRILDFYGKAGGNLGSTEYAGPGLFFFTELLKVGIDPQLIKVVTRVDEVVGVVLAFPNLSAVLQRMQGHLDLHQIANAKQQPEGVVFNGFAVLPELQIEGLNVLLFSEIDKIGRQVYVQKVDMVQVINFRMERDLKMIGASPSQRYRVYVRDL